ncbi:MAG TPA: hypothetical protein VN794_03515, partial [Methylomirabilota bacterium]|nr:hypothetical protein [Methylomirabilota bacterium]
TPHLQVNGKEVAAKRGPDGYAAIHREWGSADRLQLRFKLEPRVVIGSHQNEGRLAILYGPLVLAADEALLDGRTALSELGVPSRDLAAFHLVPEPAPAKLKSWPAERVFRINGIPRSSSGPSGAAAQPIRLVPFAEAGATGSAYKVWLPYEALPPGRNLLRDGVEIRSRKPNAGSIIDDNPETIAVTFNRKRAPQDWFGVELEEPVTVRKVVFVHGKTFHDGGWFDATAGKPQVEIQTALKGPWKSVAELKDYPPATDTDSAGLKGGERFSCELPSPMLVFGLRVLGKPAGGDNPRQAFASCGELQAFGP